MFNIFIKSAIVDNIVFVQYLAICPFIMMTDDSFKVYKTTLATILITFLSTVICWPLYNYFMLPYHLEYLQVFAFVLIIFALILIIQKYLQKSEKPLVKDFAYYISLVTINCAVLAITINAVGKDYTFVESIVYVFGSILGFFISLIAMYSIRTKLKIARVPNSFKGGPIMYISASLLSLAFLGFKGLIH